jgi:hypothetical protein
VGKDDLSGQKFQRLPKVSKICVEHGILLKVSGIIGRFKFKVVNECVELPVSPTLVVLFCQNESTRL